MTVEQKIANEKKELRKRLLAQIKDMPPIFLKEEDEKICQKILTMAEFKRAQTIFSFIGIGWEINTWPILESAINQGKLVAVPRCLAGSTKFGSGGLMDAALIANRQDLHPVPPLGLLEPRPEAPVLPPSAIDFALIPCIACDKRGYRLGQGGGFYDVFLHDKSFLKVALCRKDMLFDTLPKAEHDEKVDVVVTEDLIYFPPKDQG